MSSVFLYTIVHDDLIGAIICHTYIYMCYTLWSNFVLFSFSYIEFQLFSQPRHLPLVMAINVCTKQLNKYSDQKYDAMDMIRSYVHCWAVLLHHIMLYHQLHCTRTIAARRSCLWWWQACMDMDSPWIAGCSWWGWGLLQAGPLCPSKLWRHCLAFSLQINVLFLTASFCTPMSSFSSPINGPWSWRKAVN